MKSGVQMNFLERRACADRALSQLVRMAREATETLSSREQRGVYRLESTWAEKSNAAPPAAHVWIGSAFAARWTAFSIIVLALVRGLWIRVRVDSQKAIARARVHDAFSRMRVARHWLHKMAQRAHGHWLVLASRRHRRHTAR